MDKREVNLIRERVNNIDEKELQDIDVLLEEL